MAITVDSFEMLINASMARDILQMNTNSFGIFTDVDRIYELQGLLLLEIADAKKTIRKLSGSSNVNADNTQDVINLLRNMGVPRQEFTTSVEGSLAKTVRTAIMNNPDYSQDVHAVIETYDDYSTAKYNLSILRSWSTHPRCVQLSKMNHRMGLARPTWSVLSTSRLQTSNPNLQGLSRVLSDVITEPKGYTLVRCDSGQIEPRINFSYFLRDELIMRLIAYYDDAYFGVLHYCTMSNDDLKRCAENFDVNFKPMEITDALKDKRQLIKRMVNAGSYGSNNLDSMDPTLSRAFEQRIKKHPKRLALEQSVQKAVESGIETFYSAFGTPVTPDSTSKYQKNSSNWYHHVIKCGINNPVQTTAADLMLISVNEASKILEQAQDSWIAYYKHDEAAFYVSDKDAENGFIDKLKDITAYNVKGWLPIPADSLVGVKPSSKYPSYLGGIA